MLDIFKLNEYENSFLPTQPIKNRSDTMYDCDDVRVMATAVIVLSDLRINSLKSVSSIQNKDAESLSVKSITI